MENNLDLEITQQEYAIVKKELLNKAGIFGICFAVFLVLCKLMNSADSFWGLLEDALMFTTLMYLPYKICFQSTGAVIGSLVGSFVLVIVACLVLGEASWIVGIITFGGMAVDFGWSIYRLLTLRKTLTGNGQ